MRVSHLHLYELVGCGFDAHDMLNSIIWIYNQDYPRDPIVIIPSRDEYGSIPSIYDIRYVIRLLNHLSGSKLHEFIRHAIAIINLNETNLKTGSFREKQIESTRKIVVLLQRFDSGELVWPRKESKQQKKTRRKKEKRGLDQFIIQLAAAGEKRLQ